MKTLMFTVKGIEDYNEKENFVRMRGERTSGMGLYLSKDEPMPKLGDRYILLPEPAVADDAATYVEGMGQVDDHLGPMSEVVRRQEAGAAGVAAGVATYAATDDATYAATRAATDAATRDVTRAAVGVAAGVAAGVNAEDL